MKLNKNTQARYIEQMKTSCVCGIAEMALTNANGLRNKIKRMHAFD